MHRYLLETIHWDRLTTHVEKKVKAGIVVSLCIIWHYRTMLDIETISVCIYISINVLTGKSKEPNETEWVEYITVAVHNQIITMVEWV